MTRAVGPARNSGVRVPQPAHESRNTGLSPAVASRSALRAHGRLVDADRSFVLARSEEDRSSPERRSKRSCAACPRFDRTSPSPQDSTSPRDALRWKRPAYDGSSIADASRTTAGWRAVAGPRALSAFPGVRKGPPSRDVNYQRLGDRRAQPRLPSTASPSSRSPATCCPITTNSGSRAASTATHDERGSGIGIRDARTRRRDRVIPPPPLARSRSSARSHNRNTNSLTRRTTSVMAFFQNSYYDVRTLATARDTSSRRSTSPRRSKRHNGKRSRPRSIA